MICAGIDAGSRAIKIVLRDREAGAVVGRGMADQGPRQEERAATLLERICEQAGILSREVSSVVATGYGRNLIRRAGRKITEITCQAAGCAQIAHGARSIIDIGGQDSKFIVLGDDGRVVDFTMNDRCAAGTGRFLELAAGRLGVELDEFGRLAAASRQPALVSSMCAVFAESEMISLLAEGKAPADLAAGIARAVAQRVAALANHRPADPVLFTGGVALVESMPAALEAALQRPVLIPEHPQFTCALGAAILAGIE